MATDALYETTGQRKARRRREQEEEREQLERAEEERKDAPGQFTRAELEDFAAKYREAKEKGFI